MDVAEEGGGRNLQDLSRDELLKVLAHIRDSGGKDHVEAALKSLDEPSKDDGQGAQEQGGKKSKRQKKRDKAERKEREFDFSRHSTRQIALLLSYDGEKYLGFASQGCVADESVEGQLLIALQKVRLIQDRAWACYSRCGRTDKGVSALRQVVGLRVRSNRPLSDTDRQMSDQDRQPPDSASTVTEEEGEGEGEEAQEEDAQEARLQEDIWAQDFDTSTEGEIEYCTILNRVLPKEIRALAWVPVPVGFNARFCASSRTYRYFFPAQGLDVAAMSEAASRLVGEHDFRNLCKIDVTKTTNYRRKVYYASLRTMSSVTWTARGQGQGQGGEEAGGKVCCLEISGQAFLWHMVRCVMAVLLLVGKRLEKPEVMDYLLDVEGQCPRKPHYSMAPEVPLVLHDCAFPRLHFNYQVSTLCRVWVELRSQWGHVALKLARLQNAMDMLLHEATVPLKDVQQLIQDDRKADEIALLQQRGKKRKAPATPDNPRHPTPTPMAIDTPDGGQEGEKAAAPHPIEHLAEPSTGPSKKEPSMKASMEPSMKPSTTEPSMEPSMEASMEWVTWQQALALLEGAGVALASLPGMGNSGGGEEHGGSRLSRYTPLHLREVNRTLDEALLQISGRRKAVFEEHEKKREKGAKGRDQAFFRRLQGADAHEPRPPTDTEGRGV